MADTGSFDANVHVPGVWRCAKCNFVLVQANMNAVDGTVTARDEAGDHCPNDGAPMWRVTWKEQATEQGQLAERFHQEAQTLRTAIAPFAECVEQIEDDESDEEWAKFRLLVGDYRRAARALKGEA